MGDQQREVFISAMERRKNRILLCLCHLSGNEQKFVNEAFDTNWITPLGPNVTAFETDIEQWLNHSDSARYVTALSSGTAAIHLALLMCGVTHGDEVICQSFTFCASANPIVYLGATPVLVDSEKESLEERVMALTDGMGADFVFECSDSPAAIRSGMANATVNTATRA